MAISCVYCGSTHESAVDVRACWARTQGEEVAPPAGEASPEPNPPSAPAARPARAVRSDPSGPGSPGPDALGRNLVIAPGGSVPPAWAATPVEELTPAVLAAPAELVARLRARAARRERTVVVLAAEFPADRPPASVERRPVHQLGPRFEFALDALHHLVWSNALDATSTPAPEWPPTARAVALGARPAPPGTPGDVVLADGTAAWLDAGPLTHFGGPLDGAAVVPALTLEHGRLDPLGPNEVGPTAAELAPDQHAAVTHPGAAARIIAPAGSGKTRVLTERARHLLARWGLPTGAVCLVAFNTRAQGEMRQRTSDLPRLQVRTLNALALAIVNGSAPFASRPSTRRTIDEGDVRRLLDRLVEVPKRRNTDPLAPWIDALSLARLGLLDPTEVEDRYDGDVAGFVDVYPRYRAALAREGLLDFDEQILGAVEVLLTDPGARAAAQRACRVLLVDEFQDLAPAHLLLVRLLAGPALGVFGVGDDDQTIYGYQGADPAWLIDYARLFPGAGDHPLEVNYRCPEGVVEVADRLLRHNTRRVPKVIRAGRRGDTGWEVRPAADTLHATAEAVVVAVAAGRSPADIAVLTRVNALLAPVQAALAGRVATSGGVGPEFVERTAVRACLAWLRLADDRWSAADLGEALRRPSRPLHPNVINWVGESRSIAALSRLAERLRTPRDAERVESFGSDIGRLQAMVTAGSTTAEVLSVLLYELNLAGAVSTLDLNRRGMNRGAQHDDLTAMEQLATLQPDPRAFPRWLADIVGRKAAAGEPTVTLATVHRVKGQEWPMVVVHEASDAEFPHRLAEDVEEERRLFHVAITRAAAQLVVVTPVRGPSPFAAELVTEPTPESLKAQRSPDVASRRTASMPATTKKPSGDSPLSDKSRVIAVPGLVLVDQGQDWVVERLAEDGALARRDPATRVFRSGTKVTTASGRSGALSLPAEGDPPEAAIRAHELLRSLRRSLAAGKPAYTVFDDATLEAIALALPADLEALARIKGVGPAKLERYGDAVITAVEDALG